MTCRATYVRLTAAHASATISRSADRAGDHPSSSPILV
jgi:hypothetical protein